MDDEATRWDAEEFMRSARLASREWEREARARGERADSPRCETCGQLKTLTIKGWFCGDCNVWQRPTTEETVAWIKKNAPELFDVDEERGDI